MEVNDYQENYKTGWIKVYRSIKNHWIFENEKFLKWWFILLFEVNHKDGRMALGYELHDIKKGSSSNSLRTWATLFNTSTKSVSRFFNLLEKDNMIKRETIGKGKQSTTLVTVTNYANYQIQQETQTTTQTTTQGKRERDTNKNVKKEKKYSVADSHKEIFERWLKYRKEIKKPYKSDTSIQAVANKFNERTIECCKYVVDLSISNQWQGLFWDKYTEQKKTPNTRKTINRSDFFTD